MKRNCLSVFAAILFITFLAAPVSAWQGRMAGAGDAYGLIEDESDYLTHPAVIAMSKGFNAYGHYRLTYDKTSKWDYTVSVPFYPALYPFKTKGHEWKNEGLLGAAFQLGAGMMGVFFEYTGISGKYDGSELFTGAMSGDGFNTYDMKDRLDNYSLRLLYGLPVGSVNLGAEVQIAYRNEEKETLLIKDDGDSFLNLLYGGRTEYTLFPYMIPCKSKYWEAQGKISAAGMMGAAKYALTLKGGLPFASDNKYTSGHNSYQEELEGKVKGFNVGGDFWVRVPVNAQVVLPFVVSAGYKKIKRDGDLARWFGPISYEHEAENLYVEVGGGVDFTPAKGTKVAAGIYYDYIRTSQQAAFDDINISDGERYYDDYADMPTQTEHRLTLKALAEKELTPVFVLRVGFSMFYGLAKSDYAYVWKSAFPLTRLYDVSTDGSNMGVNIAIGATFKLKQASLEPFINGGYAKYSTSGDGIYKRTSSIAPAEIELDKTDWHVGGGLSVRF